MAFAEQSQFMVNFTGGLNTEATPLNFPENAAQAIDNFDLFITGEVKRRLGLDFEDSYLVRPETTSATNIARYAISTSEWKSVNGKGDLNFLVVQIGTKLYFHDLGASPISGTLRGTVDLSSSKTGSSPELKVMSFAYGEGVLVVANSDIDPTIIKYNDTAGTFSKEKVLMQIRDFEGVDDGYEADFRPTNLTNDHRYNLRNQGWPLTTTVNNAPRGSRGVTRNTDPLAYTRQKVDVYPSNADIFHACKSTAAEDAEVIGSYSPWTMEQIATGNTPAPQGHYILDLFSQDRVAVSGISGIDPGHTTDQRPSSVAFYAGRIWYAGIPDSEYTGDVYFSQSLTDTSVAGKCYQDYDPTAEDLNALLATDGGVIHIADLGTVYKMLAVGNDLIILASNGVWAISGEAARGNFQADKFSVRKITEQGCISKESIVLVEGRVLWWGEGGIWMMQGSQIDDSLVVDRITRDTIQGFYDEISSSSRAYARGVYDTYDKKVYWLYNDSEAYDAINNRFKYNRILILDMTLEAFYTYSISDLDTNTPWVSSIFLKTAGSETITTYDIFHLNDDVVEGADDIVQDIAFESFANVQLKLLTFVENEDTTYSYTLSEFKDRGFRDWKTWDSVRNSINNLGANYSSYIQSGWSTSQDLIRNKSITHLTSFFNRTEDGYLATNETNVVAYSNPSSAMMQLRWEFSDLDVGQWTTPQQAYRISRWYIPDDETDQFNSGYTLVKSKLRTRGKGTAFSVRYYSEEGKDLQLLGYGVNLRAGKNP